MGGMGGVTGSWSKKLILSSDAMFAGCGVNAVDDDDGDARDDEMVDAPIKIHDGRFRSTTQLSLFDSLVNQNVQRSYLLKYMMVVLEAQHN